MTDYNSLIAKKALARCNSSPKRILIIGAGSQGRDVQIFNQLTNAQSEIVGVDIEENIGESYSAENVLYIQCDATRLPIKSSNFDLAYSFATFEHIQDIGAAWQCMADSLKTGGLLFTCASPTWFHPYGHHKSDIFKDHPWLHLLCQDVDTMANYCKANGITSLDNVDLIHHIRYIHNKAYFNRLPPSAYEETAAKITGLHSKENFHELVDIEGLSIPPQLLAIHGEHALSAGTHYFIGYKS